MLRTEPATLADAEPVSAFVAALESELYGRSVFTPEDLREEWADLDLARDAFVVRDGDRIAGYGVVRERGDALTVEGYVDPRERGRGIGTLIATRLEEEAERAGTTRIQNAILEADAPAHALLAERGYQPVRVFREMRIRLGDEPPAAPEWPDGLRGTPFDPAQDAPAFHQAQEEAFADTWDHTPKDLATWSRSHLENERFDPSLWCVVRDEHDEIAAGTISTGDTYGGGFVHALFTRRPHRGRGVGAALLADAFARLHESGEREVGLSVDAASETGAFRLYERAGMTPALGWTLYEKELSATR